MAVKIKRSKENFDFMIAVILVSKPESISGMSVTMRNHIKAWEKAGIIPSIPISSGMTKKHLDDFVNRYSEEANS